MFLVLLAIGLAILAWGIVVTIKEGDALESIGRLATGTVIAAVAVIAILANIAALYEIDNIYPAKIAYLKENNAEIESKLAETIEAYQAYEKETYEAFKPDIGSDVTIAIAMYPELKSDTMVVALIETYTSNNAGIRELELAILNRPANAFWLYFGK